MKQQTKSMRDGFRILRDHFVMPHDFSGLDLRGMHSNTMCDLFLNKHLHLDEIVRLVRDDRGSVIHALIEQGVIGERRKKPREEQSSVSACLN